MASTRPYISERTIKTVMFSGDRHDLPHLMIEAGNWLIANGYGPPNYGVTLYDMKLVQNDEYDTATVILELHV